jgi:plastocyanin
MMREERSHSIFWETPCKAILALQPLGISLASDEVIPKSAHPFLVLLAICTLCAGQPAGTVIGTVPLPQRHGGRIAVEKYTGTISGKVAKAPPTRAGVWLEGAGASALPEKTKIVMEQRGYQFGESVVIVAPGTTIEFPNRDEDYHHIFSVSRPNSFEIGRFKKDTSPVPSQVFEKPGVVRLQCEIHDHMNATVLVVDSRWRTLTDNAGRFMLTGIKPGEYTLHARTDAKTHWSAPVKVEAGKTTSAQFSQQAKP